MDINFGNAQVATDCIYAGLLNRLSEDERTNLFETAVQSIRVETLPTAGRSAATGQFGVQASLPTVVYEMDKEALVIWAPRLDGMTNRVPDTVTIVRLSLREYPGDAELC